MAYIDVQHHLVLCTRANCVACIEYCIVWHMTNGPARTVQKTRNLEHIETNRLQQHFSGVTTRKEG